MLSPDELVNDAPPQTDAALDRRANQFRSELESIARRAKSASACRESILDIAVRSPYFLGAAWSLSDGREASLESTQLAGTVFERPDIQNWLKTEICNAHGEAGELTIRSTMVRNLFAVHIPVDYQSQDGSRGVPQFILTLLTTESGNRIDPAKILAAHCAMNTWRNWVVNEQRRTAQRHFEVTSRLLELEMRIARETTVDRACQVAVESLLEHANCRMIAIGLTGRRSICSLKAISGTASFDRKSSTVSHIESALNESLIRNQITSYPAAHQSEGFQTVAHKRAAESLGVDSIVSIPLEDGSGNNIGAILFGGSGSELIARDRHNELRACSIPVGSAISSVHRYEGGTFKRFTRRFANSISTSRGIVLGCLFLLASAVLAMPVTYRVPCQCRIEPVQRFYCLAPYEGLVEQTHFESGDQVQQGDLLARMDGREIAWELAGVTADQARALKELDVSLSEQQTAKAIQAELEGQRLEARAQLLQHRRQHMEIRSPATGIILGDSMDKRSNYPVKKGQLLYEVAPLETLRIEVAVPSEELANIQVGQDVEIRINGIGDTPLRGIVHKVRPQSETHHGKNVFVAEVDVANPDGLFKPGMEGTARISAGRHPLIWNYGHRFAERFMISLWW